MTLQQHMQAALAGPTPNGSTILCPKPYGVLGANITHTLDDNLVLLLPSSSVAQFWKNQRQGMQGGVPAHDEDEEDDEGDMGDDGTPGGKSSKSSYQWDGTWVE